MRILILILSIAIAAPLQAQQINIEPAIEKLLAKASKKMDIDLDAAMLGLASKFLSDRNPDEAAAKKLIEGLQSIRIWVVEFDSDGQYSSSDLEPLRAQFDCSRMRNCPWRRFLRMQGPVKRSPGSGGEDVEVWMNSNGDTSNGLFMISSEPRELVIVSIVGTIRPEDLALIGGRFGIPRIQIREE